MSLSLVTKCAACTSITDTAFDHENGVRDYKHRFICNVTNCANPIEVIYIYIYSSYNLTRSGNGQF